MYNMNFYLERLEHIESPRQFHMSDGGLCLLHDEVVIDCIASHFNFFDNWNDRGRAVFNSLFRKAWITFTNKRLIILYTPPPNQPFLGASVFNITLAMASFNERRSEVKTQIRWYIEISHDEIVGIEPKKGNILLFSHINPWKIWIGSKKIGSIQNYFKNREYTQKRHMLREIIYYIDPDPLSSAWNSSNIYEMRRLAHVKAKNYEFNEKWEKALKQYSKVAKFFPDDEWTRKSIDYCRQQL